MIFFARVAHRLPPEFTRQGSLSSIDYSGIRSLEPLELRAQVLRAVSSSIQVRSASLCLSDQLFIYIDSYQTVWTVWAPCLGLSFLVSGLLVSSIRPLENTNVKQPLALFWFAYGVHS